MDGTGEHYAKWNKPGGEGQIPYRFNLNLHEEKKGIKEEIKGNHKILPYNIPLT